MFWKIYNWLWHRAQKSAAAEIIAYANSYFPEPPTVMLQSENKAVREEYHRMRYVRHQMLRFLDHVEKEYYLPKKSVLGGLKKPTHDNLAAHMREINNFDDLQEK